ncbi:MAG: hypothetical protein RL199_1364 [Pseudomonadota bacterium]|jgi:peptidoglycan/xylan/chitin deacetylase (PgdA/CDA1 family)
MAADVIAEALAAGPRATLAVMYHYVRPPDAGLSGIVPLTPAAFRHQLELLTRHFDVVDPDTLPDGRPTSRPKAVITFDDGTRDQYDFAFPILREMGLPAVIACISGPRLLGMVPTVHLVHLLLSKLGARGLWAEVEAGGGIPADFPYEKSRSVYHYESDADRAHVKYLMNFVLGPLEAQRLASEVHARAIGPVEQLARDWYVTDEQIREMSGAGIRFAVHAQRHLPLFGPLERFYEDELKPCESWLEGLTGKRPDSYAAAFGGNSTEGLTVDALAALMRSKGYRQIYTTRPGLNLGDRFFVERVDCNKLPTGG